MKASGKTFIKVTAIILIILVFLPIKRLGGLEAHIYFSSYWQCPHW